MRRPTALRKHATGTSGKGIAKAEQGNGGLVSVLAAVMTGILLIVYFLGFVFFRIGELVPLISMYPDQCLAALIGTVSLSRLLRSPVMRRLIHVASILTLIYVLMHTFRKFYHPWTVLEVNKSRPYWSREAIVAWVLRPLVPLL